MMFYIYYIDQKVNSDIINSWKFKTQSRIQMTLSHNLQLVCICIDNKIYIQETQRDFFFRELQKFELFNVEKMLKGEAISAVQESTINKIGKSLQKLWEPIKVVSDSEGELN